jgi:Flp pilus assembly protein TadG
MTLSPIPTRFLRLLTRFRKNRRATAAVEFVLVAPILLTLIYGAIVYGLFFATWIAVTEAASEGARASLAGMSSTERQSLASTAINRIFSAYAPLLATQYMTLTFPSAANPNLFSVSIAYNFSNSGFKSFAGFVPLPATNPAITVTVSNGGY